VPGLADDLERDGGAIGAGDVSRGFATCPWLGLVPKQLSTGDRTILGKISRRASLSAVLFVQAAWVVLIKPRSGAPRVKPWIEAARKRLHQQRAGDSTCQQTRRIPGASWPGGPSRRGRWIRREPIA